MNKQLSFFETSNHDGNHSVKVAELSRRTDPSTSHEAAKKVKVSKLQLLFLNTLKPMQHAPPTANEVAARAYKYEPGVSNDKVATQRESLRKRSSKLAQAKGEGWEGPLIERCGPRECKIKENPAETFRLTELGRKVIDEQQ